MSGCLNNMALTSSAQKSTSRTIANRDFWSPTSQRHITSVQAKTVANWRSFTNDAPTFKGMVFTGEQDGRVMVAYDPRLVLPFAYTRAVDISKTFHQLRWRKFEKPPISLPAEPAPNLHQDAAMRYFKQAGYIPLVRRNFSAVFCKQQDDKWIILILKTNAYGIEDGKTENRISINAYVSRKELFVRYPDGVPNMGASEMWMQEHVQRIYSETFPPGRVPVGQVVSAIDRHIAEIDANALHAEQFGRMLLKAILRPGATIEGGLIQG